MLFQFEGPDVQMILTDRIDWDLRFSIRKDQGDLEELKIEMENGWDHNLPAVVRRNQSETTKTFIGVCGFRRASVFTGDRIPCLILIGGPDIARELQIMDHSQKGSIRRIRPISEQMIETRDVIIKDLCDHLRNEHLHPASIDQVCNLIREHFQALIDRA